MEIIRTIEEVRSIFISIWPFGFILLIVLAWIDKWLLTRIEGKIKRGWPFFQRALNADEQAYFETFSGCLNEVPEIGWVLFTKKQSPFVKKENNQIILWPLKIYRRAFVGFIDLNSSKPMLQFRSSAIAVLPFQWFLAGLIVVTRFWGFGIFIVPFLMFWYVNYRREKREIEQFVRGVVGEEQHSGGEPHGER